MTSRIRTAALALVATIALVSAPLLVTSSASAATADTHVLMFSNSAYGDTNPGQEDERTLAALQGSGATVSTFDGGDGSDTAWSAALAGINVLVFPEGTNYTPGGTSVITDAAMAVIKAWVVAGGVMIGTGGYDHLAVLNFLTGLDYSSVWGDNNSPGGLGWVLQTADPDLPATLFDVSYTGGQEVFDTWTPDLLAPLTPLYVSPDGTSLGVGTWAVGSGSFSYLAWDWFNGGGETMADWDLVLQSLVPTVAAAPALAATGSTVSAPLLGAAAFVLLAGAALMFVARRRAQRA